MPPGPRFCVQSPGRSTCTARRAGAFPARAGAACAPAVNIGGMELGAFEADRTTRIVFGPGTRRRLPEIARALGFRRTLLVADPGLVACGYAAEAESVLTDA